MHPESASGWLQIGIIGKKTMKSQFADMTSPSNFFKVAVFFCQV